MRDALGFDVTPEVLIISIELPEDVEQRLSELSRRTGRSETSFAREAILEHLDDLEDLYLAEQQRVDIRSGKIETSPLADVLQRYGMEG